MMITAKGFQTSVTTSDNSPSQGFPHQYDQSTQSNVTPVFNPLNV